MMMGKNCLSTTNAIKNYFLVVIHLSLVEVITSATAFKISDLKVSESKYGDFLEVEEDDYTVEVANNEILEQLRNYRDGDRDHSDEMVVNRFVVYSVFLELLIFICCAAGVFGICIFCCIICGQLFSSNQDGGRNLSGEESLTSAYMNNNRAIRIQHGQDETILTFISVHRNPWSPGFDGEHEAFHFENDDMPPQYEDLDLSTKLEEPCSPPPPPYTPSFNLGDNGGEKKLTS